MVDLKGGFERWLPQARGTIERYRPDARLEQIGRVERLGDGIAAVSGLPDVRLEKPVGELARLLGVREPAMSQQLAVLRREGLVRPRRDAQTIYYALARDDVRRLMEFLYATYCSEAAVIGEVEQDVVPEPAER